MATLKAGTKTGHPRRKNAYRINVNYNQGSQTVQPRKKMCSITESKLTQRHKCGRGELKLHFDRDR